MSFYRAFPWHEGEEKIHELTRVPHLDNPTQAGLPYSSALRVAASPMVALGTVDDEDNIWCTVWGGDLPIAQQVAAGGIIGVKAPIDATFDPVVQILYGGKDDGEILKCQGKQQRMVSALSIHLEDRDRVKLFGRMVAGCLDATETTKLSSEVPETTESGKKSPNKIGTAQLVLHIAQSLGNCPKYLNKKSIKSHLDSRPRLAFEGSHLSPEAISHVHSSDLFFVASRGLEDMDCNHRGGAPGFLRVEPQELDSESPSTLVWPEYSGNNLYQTLGNIVLNPVIGLVVPNLITGDVLYVTGKAEILLDREATSIISKTKLAVRLTIAKAKFVRSGLMFRGIPSTDNKDVSSSNPTVDREIKDGMSPYNPRIRYLTSELDPSNPTANLGDAMPPDEYRRSNTGQPAQLVAKLTKKNKLTPTITRYSFSLTSADPRAFTSPPTKALWKPGQYVALDFSDELYMGYSHMNDSEPTSLNDDFIRTFTIASRYVAGSGEPSFDMVIRNVGVVTRWLSRQNERAGMTELKVVGFGGDLTMEPEVEAETASGSAENNRNLAIEQITNDTNKQGRNAFIAAGIGITPLLGHLSLKPGDVDSTNLSLAIVWTLHIRDIGLAVDILPRIPVTLRRTTQLFITGVRNDGDDDENVKVLEGLQQKYAEVRFARRRMAKEDVVGLDGQGEKGGKVEKWFVCTAAVMRKQVQEWLGGKSILFENFDY